MIEFSWEKLYYSYIPAMYGSELYCQLGVSINGYDVEEIGELISEIEQVLQGDLIQTDFSSGELKDFVLVEKDESRLYPDFHDDNYLKIPTKSLLEILKQWRNFIENPPK